MSQLGFDLISDLNIIYDLDWEGQPTSLSCVVAGNISQDRNVLLETLKHLSQCYKTVFYIDGHLDHRGQLMDISGSYKELKLQISNIENVVYLHDNVAIATDIAVVACNGWWTYDFNPNIDGDQAEQLLKEDWKCNATELANVYALAYSDARYLVTSVEKLQEYEEIKKIVIITNTVPLPQLIHDTDTRDSVRFNLLGNSLVNQCILADKNNLIDTWAFGHYQNPVDEIINGIRFVSNPRYNTEDAWDRLPYNPKKIIIDR